MSGFLERMAEASRVRVRDARARTPEATLLARARAAPPPPRLALGAFDVIAELKLRSPSAGALAPDTLDLARQVEGYARGGAAAVSVLTEPDAFGGSLEHLGEAAARLAPLGVPVMRKDFLVDPYQVLEARAAGAGGVLVIVTMLSDDAVRALVASAAELGLFVLLEAFDAADLERIARLERPAGAALLAGVNCRDLRTLQVDAGRFADLAPHLPPGLPAVAESGLERAEDAARVAELGYSLALIGSALMRAGDPAAGVAAFAAAGRGAAARRGEAACS
ncbi:MAG TPA: indole-3-glycerol-phosphate synthase [Gammaproteobacteria bacterium]